MMKNMMKKLLFSLILMIFGITGVAGACRICYPPICEPPAQLNIWGDAHYIDKELEKGVAVPFSLGIIPEFNPAYDEIHSAWIGYYLRGTPDNWFVGKSDFDGGGHQWGVGHTNPFGDPDGGALILKPLWGDPLETLRTTGILSGLFKAWWCGDDELWLKKTFLLAKGCDTNPVPEPATLLLLGSGLIAFAGIGRRKILKKKKK
jgi:hypothetical protein